MCRGPVVSKLIRIIGNKSSPPPPLPHPPRCQEYLSNRQQLFQSWLSHSKDLSALNVSIQRRRTCSRLGRHTYASKRRHEVLASFQDPDKGERELALAKKEGRFFYHPSFPGDEAEACPRPGPTADPSGS